MKKQLLTLLCCLLSVGGSSALAEWVETPYGKYWTGDENQPATSSLKGTFYDYRYRANGKQHPDVAKQLDNWWGLISIRSLAICTLNDLQQGRKKNLSQIYRIPGNLYASHFYIPSREKEDVTQFLPIDKIKQHEVTEEASDFITNDTPRGKGIPGGWIAVYKGRVKAPKSGNFRFVGTADDCMIVRFSNRMVLETGCTVPSSIDKKNNDSIWNAADLGFSTTYHQEIQLGRDSVHRNYDLLKLKSTPKINKITGGFMAGAPFHVKKGEVYNIEIILMDAVNSARFFLLIQELRKDGKLAPLQLFRTDDVLPNSQIQNMNFEKPDYEEDSLIWKVPSDKKN